MNKLVAQQIPKVEAWLNADVWSPIMTAAQLARAQARDRLKGATMRCAGCLGHYPYTADAARCPHCGAERAA